MSSNGTPLVSVIVITYNHARYIRQALDSVLSQQTQFKFEILVGEDESSDGTREIVIEYQQKFPDKLKVFFRKREEVIYINGHATGVFNFYDALAHTRCKYVAFLEGDDYWTDPLKLQKQVNLMEARPDLAMCGHWVVNVNESGLRAGRQSCTGFDCPVEFSTRDALSATPLHMNTWLFRRFELVSHPAYSSLLKLPMGDDPMALVLLSQGSGYCIQQIMSAYRLHSGGTWSTKSRVFKNFETLQFRVSVPEMTGYKHLPAAVWNITYCLTLISVQLLKMTLTDERKTIYSELAKMYRGQSILTAPKLFGWYLIAVMLAPVHVIGFAVRRIGLDFWRKY